MTTDRSEQSGPEVVAWLKPYWDCVHTYDGMSPVTTYPRSDWMPLITLSSHQQAVDALRADVEKWEGRAMKERASHYDALQRAESAEARLARVAGLVETWQRRSQGLSYVMDAEEANEKCALELAAAIAPQEGEK